LGCVKKREDTVRRGLVDTQQMLASRFICAKCGASGAHVKKVAMTGTGFSRLLDFQHNRYAFASCERCGFTEVYDLRILEGSLGQGMNILDLLFGS
jgi:uncharacterized protein